MNQIISDFIHEVLHIPQQPAWLAEITVFLCLIFSSYIVYLLIHYFILGPLVRFIKKTKSTRDDFFVEHRVFHRLAMIVPLLLLYIFTKYLLKEDAFLTLLLLSCTAIILVISVLITIVSFIDACLAVYYSYPVKRQIPIQSFSQVAKVVLYLIAFLFIISIGLNKSPFSIFAGLGAAAAILMFVFKDPILGFVAGIQLIYNKMVAIGDWVEIPQHRADGTVFEIGLATVKVRNFDNTVTTVPTQDLVSNSFKNWRGMQESGGRRMKRAIYIDVQSVRLCTEKEIAQYYQFDLLTEYVQKKQAELEAHNISQVKNKAQYINKRNMTNIGTFRAYIINYLKKHPQINQNLTVLVRHLATEDKGIPIEIYAFIRNKEWLSYESIQADIFDHLYAVIESFGLRVYQQPSGYDFSCIVPE